MPDITMCTGENCPMKNTCYRHTAVPSKYRQSYFMEPPIKDEKCNHYWKIEVKRKSKKYQSSKDKETNL